MTQHNIVYLGNTKHTNLSATLKEWWEVENIKISQELQKKLLEIESIWKVNCSRYMKYSQWSIAGAVVHLKNLKVHQPDHRLWQIIRNECWYYSFHPLGTEVVIVKDYIIQTLIWSTAYIIPVCFSLTIIFHSVSDIAALYTLYRLSWSSEGIIFRDSNWKGLALLLQRIGAKINVVFLRGHMSVENPSVRGRVMCYGSVYSYSIPAFYLFPRLAAWLTRYHSLSCSTNREIVQTNPSSSCAKIPHFRS